MNPGNESKNSWEDMVFENRNKAYGAYFIRKVYSKNIVIAALLAFLTISFGLAYPRIAELFNGDDEAVHKTKLKTTVSLEQPPPINPDQPPPPSIPPPPVKTIIKF